MNQHFCTCPVSGCPRHPSQHALGCDPCIKDNLEKGKMPACFFHAVHEDMSEVKEYTVKAFVAYYLKHQDKPQ